MMIGDCIDLWRERRGNETIMFFSVWCAGGGLGKYQTCLGVYIFTGCGKGKMV